MIKVQKKKKKREICFLNEKKNLELVKQSFLDVLDLSFWSDEGMGLTEGVRVTLFFKT